MDINLRKGEVEKIYKKWLVEETLWKASLLIAYKISINFNMKRNIGNQENLYC